MPQKKAVPEFGIKDCFKFLVLIIYRVIPLNDRPFDINRIHLFFCIQRKCHHCLMQTFPNAVMWFHLIAVTMA